jgi:protein-disulfide isomerase
MRYGITARRFGICMLLCLALLPARASAEGMTKQQGDAILKELRQIRDLLEKQQRPAAAPQAAPPQERATLKLGSDYALGRNDAPVTIVEYTDYQCPYCSRWHVSTFPEIRKNYIDTGKVRFIKRDLPLSFHPNALPAAQAALCAGDQGKFWEMHERLSANPSALGPETYTRFAKELSLDAAAFQGCLASGKHVEAIRGSERSAAEAGITGTPGFVVGTAKGDTVEGVVILGAQPYAAFDRAIREILSPPAGKPPER